MGDLAEEQEIADLAETEVAEEDLVVEEEVQVHIIHRQAGLAEQVHLIILEVEIEIPAEAEAKAEKKVGAETEIGIEVEIEVMDIVVEEVLEEIEDTKR